MRQFRWLVLLIVAVSLLLPIVWGTPRVIEGQSGGDTWRNVIFDFQTLIAGALAVFAAWWTVDTMERTDLRAEQRHQQMLEATIFRDKIVLERARHEMQKRIKGIQTIAKKLTTEYLEQRKALGNSALKVVLINAWSSVGAMRRTLKSEDWLRASHLLNPSLADACTELDGSCEQFLWFCPDKDDLFQQDFAPTTEQLEWITGNTREILLNACAELQIQLSSWKIA